MASTSAIPVTDWKAVNYENFSFRDVSINKQGGGRNVQVQYKSPEDGKVTAFRMLTPRMRFPFGGCSTFTDATDPSKSSSSVSVGFDSKDPSSMSPVCQEFFRFFEGLDAYFLEAAKNNAAAWFPPKQNKQTRLFEAPSPDQIEGMWTESIKWAKPDATGTIPDYPPTVKSKIRIVKGNMMTMFFNNDKPPTLITSEDVTSNSEGVCLWEMVGIWIVQGKLGISWSCIQVKSYGTSFPTTYAIHTESDDEVDDCPGLEDAETADGSAPKRQKTAEAVDE